MTTAATSAHNNHALLSEFIVPSYSKIVSAFGRCGDTRTLRQAAEYTSRFMRVDRSREAASTIGCQRSKLLAISLAEHAANDAALQKVAGTAEKIGGLGWT